MTFGELIAKAAEWARGLVPFVVVHEWETGVRLCFGRLGSVVDPGLRWFWPLAGEIVTELATVRVSETPPQTVGTYTFQLAVRWKVRDIALMYGKIGGAETTVVNTVMRVAGRSTVDCEDPKFLRAVRKKMYGWGIEVQDVGYTTYTEAHAIRLIGSHDSASWEEVD